MYWVDSEPGIISSPSWIAKREGLEGYLLQFSCLPQLNLLKSGPIKSCVIRVISKKLRSLLTAEVLVPVAVSSLCHK